MKKQIFQKYNLGLALTLLSLGLFVLFPAFANANGLIEVVFETGEDPLFQEANFLPGQEITHWVEVTNKSGQTLPIGVKMTKLVCSGSETYCLADKLNLEIKNGTTLTTLYGPVSLTQFYNDDEVKISDLEPNVPTRYNFSITFLAESGDDYQGLELGFDFKIGVLGTESIGGEGSGGGTGGGTTGGGGIYFVSGLEIYNENALVSGENQATITWLTNQPATSRVIYSSGDEEHTLELDNLPNYGYAHSTEENTTPVTGHKMVISGLEPGTTYYYRCVSHGSFAVSLEHSFTTLGVKQTEEEAGPGAGETPGQLPTAEVPAGEEPASAEAPAGEEEISGELGLPELIELGVEQEPKTGLGRFLAAIGSFFGSVSFCLILFILIIVLLVLSLLAVIEQKNKDAQKKKKWLILNLIILLLLILYYFLCPFSLYRWLIIFILVVLIVLLSLFKNRKKQEQ